MSHSHAVAARQKKQADAEAVGIDEAFISRLVDDFYARIRNDAVLGPIFHDRITDWPSHLARMKAFWRSVLYKSGEFSGNPMVKHIAIPKIAEPEFSRWLALFGETLDAIDVAPAAKDLVMARAQMIAESLLLGIRIHRDGITHPTKMKDMSCCKN